MFTLISLAAVLALTAKVVANKNDERVQVKLYVYSDDKKDNS